MTAGLYGMASADVAPDAHADAPAPETIFPIQLDLELGGAVGSHTLTNNLYFSASFAISLKTINNGPWNVFAGVGVSDDAILYWKREGKEAPDAITTLHNPGLEGRIGLAYGTRFGGPRLTLKVTPQWAYGTEMNLPAESRSLGFRASIGAAYPAWLVGLFDTDSDDKDTRGASVLGIIAAVLIPSELEYVFQAVPGDRRHGIMFGWSL